ncbi:MAG: PTS ascorbate transporter subunit IIC [Alphaproteobacteria bacterium]
MEEQHLVQETIKLFFDGFMAEPAILLGLVTMLGYAAMKRPAWQVLAGGMKTAVGFMILQQGAGLMVRTFRPLMFQFTEMFGVQGIILDPYSGLPAATQGLGQIGAGSWVAYTMILGLTVNILLVVFKRFTHLKTIFLTGHIMFLQSAMATFLTHHILGFGMVGTIVIAGLFMGLYWSICSNLTLKPTEEITGGAGFAIGHQQMFGDWLAYKLAPFFGKREDSIENMKLPGWLHIFQDNVAASGVIMTLFFGTIMGVMWVYGGITAADGQSFFAAGNAAIMGIEGLPGKVVLTRIGLTALIFPVGVTIILTGVKMFVAELTQSFEGIRQKIIPGAAIAVDCAAVYGFAGGVVLWGFVFGAIGQIIGVITLIAVGSPILAIPGFVPMFFDNATIGIFANKFGGRKALMIICVASGLIQIFGGTYAAHLSGLADPANTPFPGYGGSFDLDTVWVGVMWLFKLIASVFGLGA